MDRDVNNFLANLLSAGKPAAGSDPSEWWKDTCKGEFRDCRKFQQCMPIYADHLHTMFQNVLVDGSTSCIPGQDPACNDEEDDPYECGERDNDGRTTPVTASSGKRGSSNQSTGASPQKRTRWSSSSASEPKGHRTPQSSLWLDGIVSKLEEQKQAVIAHMNELKTWEQSQQELEDQQIDTCWAIAYECGVQDGSDEYFAAMELFENQYNRKNFIHKMKSNEVRLAWLKRNAQKPKV